MVDSLLVIAATLQDIPPAHDPLIYRFRMHRGIHESYVGDKQVAESMLRTAYEEARTRLGEEERVVRDLRSELGNLLLRALQTEAARIILEQNVEIETRLAGPDHPVTLKAVNNLGMVYRQLADYPRAREMLSRALDTKIRTLGPAHPSTATGHHNLALVLRELGELDEAESHHVPAVAVADTLFRPEDPRVPHFRSGYAGTLFRMGRHAEARRLHLDSQAALVEMYGLDHARIQAICQELADSCEALGYTDEAAKWRLMIR
jgi:tetratricopeptide (TPR) repeat protein